MKFFAVFSLTVAFSFSLYAVVKIEIPRIFMQLTVPTESKRIIHLGIYAAGNVTPYY